MFFYFLRTASCETHTFETIVDRDFVHEMFKTFSRNFHDAFSRVFTDVFSRAPAGP